MSSPLVQLTAAVLELPPAQRAVLLPLFTWGLIKNAPKDAVIPDSFRNDVEQFFESLGPDPEQWSAELDKRLQAAGVTSATLQALTLEAGMSADVSSFASSVAGNFEKRATPKEGQARSGPAARFALETLLAMQKK